MTNHPNRERRAPRVAHPSPDQIRAARSAANLTQTQAAHLVYRAETAWQRYEAGERKMDPAAYELFRIKAGLDPVDMIADSSDRDPADRDL